MGWKLGDGSGRFGGIPGMGWRWVAAISAAAAIAAGWPAPSPGVLRVSVSLCVFSGRPDPNWELRGAEAERTRAALLALPARPGRGPDADLRDAAFLVSWTERSGAKRLFYVYRGMASEAASAHFRYLRDPGGRAAHLLLAGARGRLAPAYMAVARRAHGQ